MELTFFHNFSCSFSSIFFHFFSFSFFTSSLFVFHTGSYLSLMISMLIVVGVIALMMTASVQGDDIQALRNTISSLCSLNSVGSFASCCTSYNNGATVTFDYSPARTCFTFLLYPGPGSVLASVFVVRSPLFCFASHLRCFFSFFFRCFLGVSETGVLVF